MEEALLYRTDPDVFDDVAGGEVSGSRREELCQV
jgi:hypothetical protein